MGRRLKLVVATTATPGHYHNHFVINSVSWLMGKFYNSPATTPGCGRYRTGCAGSTPSL